MDAGKNVEFDTPLNLLTNYEGGFFFNLVKNTGESNAKYLMSLAKGQNYSV